jgi:D-glycero-D-manno-heptose 1,7-bisphosphate phosphatase
MIKCVFFDRDGIVNRHPGEGYYVESWADFHLVPEFVDILRIVRDQGYAAAIVTNQRGIALGRMRRQTVAGMHRRLRHLLHKTHGLDLLDILCCPHNKGVCECRKPKPGMLLEAARRHGIDLRQSWMIGDSASDMEAGRRAGCRTVLVGTASAAASADVQVANMRALRSVIANLLGGG